MLGDPPVPAERRHLLHGDGLGCGARSKHVDVSGGPAGGRVTSRRETRTIARPKKSSLRASREATNLDVRHHACRDGTCQWRLLQMSEGHTLAS